MIYSTKDTSVHVASAVANPATLPTPVPKPIPTGPRSSIPDLEPVLFVEVSSSVLSIETDSQVERGSPAVVFPRSSQPIFGRSASNQDLLDRFQPYGNVLRCAHPLNTMQTVAHDERF